jgi:hypothetical protein
LTNYLTNLLPKNTDDTKKPEKKQIEPSELKKEKLTIIKSKREQDDDGSQFFTSTNQKKKQALSQKPE